MEPKSNHETKNSGGTTAEFNNVELSGQEPFSRNLAPQQWHALLNQQYQDLKLRFPTLYAELRADVPDIWTRFEGILGALNHGSNSFENLPLDPEALFKSDLSALYQLKDLFSKLQISINEGYNLLPYQRCGFQHEEDMGRALLPFAKVTVSFYNFINYRHMQALDAPHEAQFQKLLVELRKLTKEE